MSCYHQCPRIVLVEPKPAPPTTAPPTTAAPTCTVNYLSTQTIELCCVSGRIISDWIRESSDCTCLTAPTGQFNNQFLWACAGTVEITGSVVVDIEGLQNSENESIFLRLNVNGSFTDSRTLFSGPIVANEDQKVTVPFTFNTTIPSPQLFFTLVGAQSSPFVSPQIFKGVLTDLKITLRFTSESGCSC